MAFRGSYSSIKGHAAPVRLTFGGGVWRLEVEVLEQASPVMFKPVRHTVEGPEPIVEALLEIGAPSKIVEATARLLETHGGEGELDLVPRDEQWVPASAFSAQREPRQPRALRAGDLTARKQALRRILDRLTAAQRSTARGALIQRRVARLETQLRELRTSWPAGSVPPLAIAPTAHETALAAVDAPPPEGGRAAAGPRSAPGERPTLRVLPAAEEVQKALRALLGEGAQVVEAGRAALPATAYAARIVDADGETIGAMLTDLRGAVTLGGSLLMISEAAVEERLATGEPGPEILDALGEIFSTALETLVFEGNPRIRLESVAALSVGELEWLDSSGLRLEMAVSGRGRFVIVAR